MPRLAASFTNLLSPFSEVVMLRLMLKLLLLLLKRLMLRMIRLLLLLRLVSRLLPWKVLRLMRIKIVLLLLLRPPLLMTPTAVPATGSIFAASVAVGTSTSPASHFLTAPSLEASGQDMAVRTIWSLVDLLHVDQDMLKFSERIIKLESKSLRDEV